MRRLRRLDGAEAEVRITRDDFIRTPREAQRSWLVNRALNEFVDDLRWLDATAGKLVPGRDHASIGDRTQATLRDDEIMEDWQIPIMQAMAEVVTAGGGDILEVGFGRGVSATFIQDAGVATHTIVECNDDVIARFHDWRARYEGREIQLVRGRWQDTAAAWGKYDGIFFHTYPLNEEEYAAYVVQSVTFAEHFFPTAAEHLRPGGVFTYLTNEADSLSRAHQRLLLRHFRTFTQTLVTGLPLPPDSRDDLWADSMIVVGAVR